MFEVFSKQTNFSRKFGKFGEFSTKTEFGFHFTREIIQQYFCGNDDDLSIFFCNCPLLITLLPQLFWCFMRLLGKFINYLQIKCAEGLNQAHPSKIC